VLAIRLQLWFYVGRLSGNAVSQHQKAVLANGGGDVPSFLVWLTIDSTLHINVRVNRRRHYTPFNILVRVN